MTSTFGFISTYPPTVCGLATFTTALRTALVPDGAGPAPVVRLVDTSDAPSVDVGAAGPIGDLVAGDPHRLLAAARSLDGCDVAVVQHEYGVYGGRDGDEVLALLDALRVPAIVVLHTVLTTPTPHQRTVLQAVLDRADAVVTMTAAAHDRLLAGYRVDAGRVVVIPHGAGAGVDPAVTDRAPGDRPTIVTWGLIGPGKGIEWAIEAMALLRDVTPAPRYVVAGRTHPKVLAREGEAYRTARHEQIRRLGLAATVELDGRYHESASLARLVASADVVVLPYDSTDQVTSGVLIEAVAAGKPVVATAFPHASELLAGGAGLVVAHRDPAALAGALRAVLTEPGVAAAMGTAATASAPELLWPAVATSYRELAARVLSARVAA